jgi:hypothetical protein
MDKCPECNHETHPAIDCPVCGCIHEHCVHGVAFGGRCPECAEDERYQHGDYQRDIRRGT